MQGFLKAHLSAETALAVKIKLNGQYFVVHYFKDVLNDLVAVVAVKMAVLGRELDDIFNILIGRAFFVVFFLIIRVESSVLAVDYEHLVLFYFGVNAERRNGAENSIEHCHFNHPRRAPKGRTPLNL